MIELICPHCHEASLVMMLSGVVMVLVAPLVARLMF